MRVTLHHPDHEFTPRNVKSFEAWAKKNVDLPDNTHAIVHFKTKTVHYRLIRGVGWRGLREVFKGEL